MLSLLPALLRLVTALVTGAVLTLLAVPIAHAQTAVPRTDAARSPRATYPISAEHVPEPPPLTLLALGAAAMLGAAAHGWRQGGGPQEEW